MEKSSPCHTPASGLRRTAACRQHADGKVLAVPYSGFGWPDDGAVALAVGQALQPADPGEQGLEAGPHQIGQRRVAGAWRRAGSAAVDDLPGDSDDYRA